MTQKSQVIDTKYLELFFCVGAHKPTQWQRATVSFLFEHQPN